MLTWSWESGATRPAAASTSISSAVASSVAPTARAVRVRSRAGIPPARSRDGGAAAHARPRSPVRCRTSRTAPTAPGSTRVGSGAGRAGAGAARSMTVRAGSAGPAWRRIETTSAGTTARSPPRGTRRWWARSQSTGLRSGSGWRRASATVPITGPASSRCRAAVAPAGAKASSARSDSGSRAYPATTGSSAATRGPRSAGTIRSRAGPTRCSDLSDPHSNASERILTTTARTRSMAVRSPGRAPPNSDARAVGRTGSGPIAAASTTCSANWS